MVIACSSTVARIFVLGSDISILSLRLAIAQPGETFSRGPSEEKMFLNFAFENDAFCCSLYF